MSNPHSRYAEVTHGAIQNTATTDWMRFPLNPTEFQTSLAVNYAQQSTIGGSHQWLQYTGTQNQRFNMRLVFSRYVFNSLFVPTNSNVSAVDRDRLQWEYEDNKRFLLELCYPRGRASDSLQRSPAPALILWPANVGIIAVLRNLTITDNRFDQYSRVKQYTCECQWEEYRQYRLTASDIRQKGLKQAKAIV